MKRATFLMLAVLLVVMTFLPVAAQEPGPVMPNGTHWELHLIGSPNGISGDYSNGHSIMIPLKNTKPAAPISCDRDEVIYTPDPALYYTATRPDGAKLHWVLGDSFAIIDRDATDGDATIQIPWVAEGSDEMAVSVWVRVHGKPNTCMDINAWAVDEVNGTNYYFLAGTLLLSRKTGKAAWTNVDDLFDVEWCQLVVTDPITGAVACSGPTSEYSVFAPQFIDYFWDIVNNGMRNVEIRLYPTAVE